MVGAWLNLRTMSCISAAETMQLMALPPFIIHYHTKHAPKNGI
jgi:hypothetical protein